MGSPLFYTNFNFWVTKASSVVLVLNGTRARVKNRSKVDFYRLRCKVYGLERLDLLPLFVQFGFELALFELTP